jgi:hypothetical protein
MAMSVPFRVGCAVPFNDALPGGNPLERTFDIMEMRNWLLKSRHGSGCEASLKRFVKRVREWLYLLRSEKASKATERLP